MRDLNHHDLAEDALRNGERYRILFESTLTGNFVSTRSGQILSCNEALASLLGYSSADQAKAGNWITACPDAKTIDALLLYLQTHTRAERWPLTLRRCDGRLVHVVAYVAGVRRSDGDISEFHGQVLDDTERHDLELRLSQAQKMAMIGLLASGIAHDFNNQLTAILGFAELLSAQIGLHTSMSQDLRQIVQAARHAAALTRQLLAFSRREDPTLTVVDMNRVVQDLRSVLVRILGETISVVIRLDDDLYPVMADSQQLGQVLMNLALNARDAIKAEGQITIETCNVELDHDYVRVHHEAHTGAHACLRVRDTGAGMTAEAQSRIFEPFFTTKDRGRGTGLGLAVVHGIVDRLRGHVRVDSIPGLGTTFEVYLPRATESAPVGSGAVQTIHSIPFSGTETVLMVEDENNVRSFTKTVLTRSGYHVLEAESAEAALSMLEEYRRPVHLLLTDVVLPAIDGRRLCEQVHVRWPALPVLFMSGYVGDEDAIRELLGTSVRLLKKPFTGRELLKTVRDLLDRTQTAEVGGVPE
jgi:PAS domain S-box-containing protein